MPDRPPEIHYSFGSEALDVIWVSLCPLISKRFEDALRAAALTGWDVFPVRVTDRQGLPMPDYKGLSITGRSKSVWVNKERVFWIENHRNVMVPFWKGIEFDSQSWNGSDLFRAADGATDFVIATSAVHECLTRSGITNISLSPIRDKMIRASGIHAHRLNGSEHS